MGKNTPQMRLQVHTAITSTCSRKEEKARGGDWVGEGEGVGGWVGERGGG